MFDNFIFKIIIIIEKNNSTYVLYERKDFQREIVHKIIFFSHDA